MKSRTILYALIALIVLIILVLFLRNPIKSASTSQTNAAPVKVYSFAVKDKKLASGPDKMNVTEGDHVKITLTSDADYPELHLHGYELKTPIKKDAPVTLDFKADKTGSYVMEVHFVEDATSGNDSATPSDTSGGDKELQVSHLEVQPR